MIDEKTAMRWADESMFRESSQWGGFYLVAPEEIHSLVVRAMNEAYERAAALSEDGDDQLMGEWHGKRIRALKQEPPK